MKAVLLLLKAAVLGIGLIGLTTTLSGCEGDSATNAEIIERVLQTNLVSDIPGVAANTDANLANPWGIAFSPTGPFWVADNKTGKATVYNSSGTPQALVVNIPSPTGLTGGAPTGQVFNGTTDFKLPNGSPALFLFSTADGTIIGWNAASGSQAIVVADRSMIPGVGPANYKGLAIGSNTTGNFVYATNFRSGKVDVFDKNFAQVTLSGTFTDPAVPPGYAPFGIQNVQGSLFVTYALQDASKQDDTAGAGNGIVDVFDTSGNLMQRFAVGSSAGGSVSALNSPWGIALAPSTFGALANTVLIGNFGDGRISAFERSSGKFLGQLRNGVGLAPVAIPGLWALTFGNGGTAGSSDVLFFTAGIGDAPTYVVNKENHGLFGSLQRTP